MLYDSVFVLLLLSFCLGTLILPSIKIALRSKSPILRRLKKTQLLSPCNLWRIDIGGDETVHGQRIFDPHDACARRIGACQPQRRMQAFGVAHKVHWDTD